MSLLPVSRFLFFWAVSNAVEFRHGGPPQPSGRRGAETGGSGNPSRHGFSVAGNRGVGKALSSPGSTESESSIVCGSKYQRTESESPAAGNALSMLSPSASTKNTRRFKPGVTSAMVAMVSRANGWVPGTTAGAGAATQPVSSSVIAIAQPRTCPGQGARPTRSPTKRPGVLGSKRVTNPTW